MSEAARVCSQCGVERPLDRFYADARARGGRRADCIDCRSTKDAVRRAMLGPKEREDRSAKNREWHRQNVERVKAAREAYDSTPQGVWAKVVSHKQSGKHAFDLEKQSFLAWYACVPKRCEYCGLDANETAAVLRALKVRRASRRLELDRKNSKLGYHLENLVLACAICNYHKSDFFSHEEFKAIASRYLIPKFRGILEAETQTS